MADSFANARSVLSKPLQRSRPEQCFFLETSSYSLWAHHNVCACTKAAVDTYSLFPLLLPCNHKCWEDCASKTAAACRVLRDFTPTFELWCTEYCSLEDESMFYRVKWVQNVWMTTHADVSLAPIAHCSPTSKCSLETHTLGAFGKKKSKEVGGSWSPCSSSLKWKIAHPTSTSQSTSRGLDPRKLA